MNRETGAARGLQEIVEQLVGRDPLLRPYCGALTRRLRRVDEIEKRLTGGRMSLADFASGHEYFGLHRRGGEWVLREWAPNATRMDLVGQMTDWQEKKAFALEPLEGAEGVWEIRLSPDAMAHGDLYRLRVHWPGGHGDRIPAWARRVVQDPHTLIFNAQVWDPPDPYRWRQEGFRCPTQPPSSTRPMWAWPRRRKASAPTASSQKGILPRIVARGLQHHPAHGDPGASLLRVLRLPGQQFLRRLVPIRHAGGSQGTDRRGPCRGTLRGHGPHPLPCRLERGGGARPFRRHAPPVFPRRVRGAATRAGIRAASITPNPRSCTSCSPTAASGWTNSVSTASASTA